MMNEAVSITLPAQWATALVNGNTEALNPEEAAEIDAFLTANDDILRFVDAGEPYVGKYNGKHYLVADMTAYLH